MAYPSDPYRREPSWFLPLALLFIVIAVASYFFASRTANKNDPVVPVVRREITPRGNLAESEMTTIELFRRVAPSTVHVTAARRRRSGYSMKPMLVAEGTGTGIVWDDRGHIVTNHHVLLSRAEHFVNFLGDEKDYPAQVIGTSKDHDLAVLRVDAPAERLKSIAIGTSADLQVGQFVMAIGNPFGLDHTCTIGVVSALNRQIKAPSGMIIAGVIQTDAAINPGNSGGPLIDSAGRLIGVNSAIASEVGQSAGIGFAIPVDTVNWVVSQIIARGEVLRPRIGVEVYQTDEIRGAYVSDVVPGSVAERIGLRGMKTVRGQVTDDGDIITRVGDTTIRSWRDLSSALERVANGQPFELTIIRDGREMKLSATLSPPTEGER